MQLSVIIITNNEEENIRRCLEALQWVEDIVIVDSHSTDQTVAIAESYSQVQVIDSDWYGYSENKEIAVKHTKHEWVLWVDADEEVAKSLKEEIQQLDLNSAKYAAYAIKRANFFMGKRVYHSGWGSDIVVRLFAKSKCRFDGRKVHEKLIVNGDTGRLKGDLFHYTYKSLKDYLVKFQIYSDNFALQKGKNSKKVGFVHLFIKPSFRFVKHYFFKLGILDGKVGFIISAFSSYSVFLKYLKLWRIQQGEEL